MDRFFGSLARVVVRLRIPIILVWIAVAVVGTMTLPSMTSEINNNNSQFLPTSAPSSRAAALAAPILGNATATSQVIVVASTTGGPLNAADQSAIARRVTALRRVASVERAEETKVSPSGSAAQIAVTASVAASDIKAQKTLVAGIDSALARAGTAPGVAFHLAGAVATNVASQNSSSKTGHRVQSLSLLLIIVLLLLIFRAPLAAVVTLLPPAFALVISIRFIGALGANGLKISEITDILLIVLLLGAGTDYGLFLVFRVREAMATGMDAKEAVTHALVRVGESITASAGTVIVALLTLLLASFGIYHDLGIPLAVGVGVMLLAGLTLLPALLATFGQAAFWPRRPHRRDPDRIGVWGAIAARIVRRPAVTLGIGVLAFAAVASAALGYHSGGFGGATSAPTGSGAATGNAIVAAQFPRSSANPANLVLSYPRPVWTDPEVLVRAGNSLDGSHRFTQLSGPLDPNGTVLSPAQLTALHSRLGPPGRLPAVEPASAGVPAAQYNAYRATAVFVSPNGRVVQFEATLRAGAQTTTAALDATPAIRHTLATAAAASGATASGVAGQAAALYDVSATSSHDLVTIVPIAIVAIALLLALVLRSLVAPLYLIVSVALSYLAALGLSTLAFIDIGGDGGLTFILPFLLFIFLLALGEDYNILVMTRIREESRHRPLREAVVEAVGRTGPTITSAGVILAGSFAVIGVAGGGGSGGTQIQAIGFGLAIGILMDTFVVRTVLVPSAVALLGRYNWWPAGMSRRPAHAPREGLRPGGGHDAVLEEAPDLRA
ncbi:MAG TPA: MMPL family transporter [Acidimicrobiales bacterium]|nr:MMPL family transporter [Acidimicrobiales bacterium]